MVRENEGVDTPSNMVHGIWGKLHSLALYWKGWRYIYRATDMHTHVQLVSYVMLNIILIFNLLWMPSSIHTKVQCCLSWIHFMTMMTMKDNLILFCWSVTILWEKNVALLSKFQAISGGVEVHNRPIKFDENSPFYITFHKWSYIYTFLF